MSVPSFDYARPTIAGDASDDDASVIDDLVESYALPPTPEQLPLEATTASEKPKQATRLMTGSIQPDATWNPTQILPADPDRISLRIYVDGLIGESVRMADDADKLHARMSSHLLFVGEIYENAHTGPVWILVHAEEANTEAVLVTWAAVTK